MAFPIIGIKQDWGIRIRGIEEWQKFLKGMEKEIGINSNMADDIGFTGIAMIKEQINSGIDMDNKAMAPYSEKYAKQKGSSVVDMQLSKNMVKSIKYTKQFSTNRVVIIVSPTGTKNKVKAWVHHIGAISGRRAGRFRQKTRRWFGLTSKNVTRIQQIAVTRLESYLEKFSGGKFGQKRLF